jgi:hypothetical protein
MSVASLPTAATPKPRRWFGRNWKWFVPSMLLGTVLLAALAVFGYVQIRSYRYRQNPAYQAAIAAVQVSPQAQARLGSPIVDSDWNPQGLIDVGDGTIGEALFNFTVTGPQGSAEVATQGRMVSGEWAVTHLELRFAENERLNLTEEVEAKQKVDTPAFDLEAEKQRQPKAADSTEDDAARVLNVDVPDAPPDIK